MKSARMSLVFSFLLLFFCAGVCPLRAQQDLPPMPEGPLLLTSVTPPMLQADFWINRLPDPHRVLMNDRERRSFNAFLNAGGVPGRVDVLALDSTRAAAPVAAELDDTFKALRGRTLYGLDGKRIERSYFDGTMKARMNYGSMSPRIDIRFGAAIREVSVRAIPTDTVMLEAPDDPEFDQLQYTKIKLWTPVAVLNQSQGGDWFFVQAPYTRGWVRAAGIALFGSKAALKKQTEDGSFLVVTGESVPVFSDPARTAVLQRPTMGTRLPLISKDPTGFTVGMPVRQADGTGVVGRGYISPNSDVTEGFMPYTQANAIRQAFKLLGERYGWGGAFGGRDCSGFTHDVFLSLGIDMPRNSKEQVFAGTQLGHFEPYFDQDKKAAVLRTAKPGVTLIRKPLHMMLYLGEIDGHFYIIHSTWAERVSMYSDEKNRINQVVVSDMSLNGKSYLGSLFDKTSEITQVT